MWWGAGMSAAAVLLGAAIAVGNTGSPSIDLWWNEMVITHRSDAVLTLAHLLDHLGGGWVAILVVPLLVIIPLILTRRWRGALFAAASFLASAGAVQLLKSVYGRARPEDMLVTSDVGSFPSGHVANAATIAIVLYLLFPRVRVAIAGTVWILAMALSRTVLSVHWMTDTVGGVLVGAGVTLLLAAGILPWARTITPPARHVDDARRPGAWR